MAKRYQCLSRHTETVEKYVLQIFDTMRKYHGMGQRERLLLQIAVELDVPVLAYGLRCDFAAQGFPGSRRLLELAHNIEEMKTICRCGRKAIFNARRVEGQFVFEGDQIVIDGSQKTEYVPLCANCYFAERKAASRR